MILRTFNNFHYHIISVGLTKYTLFKPTLEKQRISFPQDINFYYFNITLNTNITGKKIPLYFLYNVINSLNSVLKDH